MVYYDVDDMAYVLLIIWRFVLLIIWRDVLLMIRHVVRRLVYVAEWAYSCTARLFAWSQWLSHQPGKN